MRIPYPLSRLGSVFSQFFFLSRHSGPGSARAALSHAARVEFPGTDGFVYAIAVDAEAKVAYVGGEFSKVGGNYVRISRRLTFPAGLSCRGTRATDDAVQTLAVADGLVYVGGNFTAVGAEIVVTLLRSMQKRGP